MDYGENTISDKDRLLQQVLSSTSIKPQSNTVNQSSTTSKGDDMSKLSNHEVQNEMDENKVEHKAAPESLEKTHTMDVELEDMDMDTQSDGDSSMDIGEVNETIEPKEPRLPRLSDLAGQGSVRVKVNPRVMITVSYTKNEIQDYARRINNVRVGDSHYSFASPLRKGDGSSKDAFGALRRPLLSFVAYLESLCNKGDVVLVGTPDAASKSLNDLAGSILVEGTRFLYEEFVDEHGRPQIKLPVKRTDDSDSDEIAIDASVAPEFETIDVRSVYDLSTWDNVVQEEDGSFTLNVLFNLNLQIPVMASHKDPAKVLRSVYKVLKLLVIGSPSVEYLFAVAFDAEDLIDPRVRLLFEELLTDSTLSPTGEDYALISDNYLERALVAEEDDFGILPAAMTREEIKDMVFVHGGSLLAVGLTPLNASEDV